MENLAITHLQKELKGLLEISYPKQELEERVNTLIQGTIAGFIKNHIGQWEKIDGDWNRASSEEKIWLLNQCIAHFKKKFGKTEEIELPSVAATMSPHKTVKAKLRQEETELEISDYKEKIRSLLTEIHQNTQQYFIKNKMHNIEMQLITLDNHAKKMAFLEEEKDRLEAMLTKSESEESEVQSQTPAEPKEREAMEKQAKQSPNPTIKKIKDAFKRNSRK